MEVKVCKNCRRLFKYIYGPELCPECTKLTANDQKEGVNKKPTVSLKPVVAEEEDKFNQVRDYIMTHPRATIIQISEVNDIAPTKLLEWIREDRLEFSEDSQDAWFECQKCGAKIKSGRLCNRCKIREKV
ncbi:MAG: flagellar protein [Herbinix sp.]|nr:flagellar protein [Herbinix sp.]